MKTATKARRKPRHRHRPTHRTARPQIGEPVPKIRPRIRTLGYSIQIGPQVYHTVREAAQLRHTSPGAIHRLIRQGRALRLEVTGDGDGAGKSHDGAPPHVTIPPMVFDTTPLREKARSLLHVTAMPAIAKDGAKDPLAAVNKERLARHRGPAPEEVLSMPRTKSPKQPPTLTGEDIVASLGEILKQLRTGQPEPTVEAITWLDDLRLTISTQAVIHSK